ncbi:heme NO-binding domain-containing protein [Polyangium spumosum]|uniref:heme NO-binding domain-containing protein n=1 Tax=Polyangium spumosum TaxID=889282 RepID=UPI00129BEB46
MLGVILLGFQNYVRDRLGEELWRTVQTEAGVAGRVYLPSQSYPGEELQALVSSLSRLTGMTMPLVLESFGDKLAAELLRVYGGLLDPRWRVLDVLIHSEELVERMAQRNGDITPQSPLTGRWGKDGEVILSYQSHLKHCALIKGIVRGMGANLEQPVLIEEIRCMLTGATACELAVRLERTQQAQGNARRLTPPAMSYSAVKAALFTDRSDRSSVLPGPPSSKQEASSSWRTNLTTIPPPSGVVPARSSSPSSAPSPAPSTSPSTSPSTPPSAEGEPSELGRRR